MMTIQAVVSDDRRYVRMTIVPFFTQIGNVETFTFDGKLFTLAWDVNPKGDIVGVHGDNSAGTVGVPVHPRGFLRTKQGDYRNLEVVGASATQVFGINSRREIVGAYTDATGTHGFVYQLARGNQ